MDQRKVSTLFILSTKLCLCDITLIILARIGFRRGNSKITLIRTADDDVVQKLTPFLTCHGQIFRQNFILRELFSVLLSFSKGVLEAKLGHGGYTSIYVTMKGK